MDKRLTKQCLLTGASMHENGSVQPPLLISSTSSPKTLTSSLMISEILTGKNIFYCSFL